MTTERCGYQLHHPDRATITCQRARGHVGRHGSMTGDGTDYRWDDDALSYGGRTFPALGRCGETSLISGHAGGAIREPENPFVCELIRGHDGRHQHGPAWWVSGSEPLCGRPKPGTPPESFALCGRPAGHAGRHSWESDGFVAGGVGASTTPGSIQREVARLSRLGRIVDAEQLLARWAMAYRERTPVSTDLGAIEESGVDIPNRCDDITVLPGNGSLLPRRELRCELRAGHESGHKFGEWQWDGAGFYVAGHTAGKRCDHKLSTVVGDGTMPLVQCETAWGHGINHVSGKRGWVKYSMDPGQDRRAEKARPRLSEEQSERWLGVIREMGTDASRRVRDEHRADGGCGAMLNGFMCYRRHGHADSAHSFRISLAENDPGQLSKFRESWDKLTKTAGARWRLPHLFPVGEYVQVSTIGAERKLVDDGRCWLPQGHQSSCMFDPPLIVGRETETPTAFIPRERCLGSNRDFYSGRLGRPFVDDSGARPSARCKLRQDLRQLLAENGVLSNPGWGDDEIATAIRDLVARE